MMHKKSLHWLRITLIVLLSLTMLLPFFWMVIASFKPLYLVFDFPPDLHPSTFTTDAYSSAFGMSYLSLPRSIFNSLFIAVTTTVGSLITASLAAYAFAKIRFKGRDTLFLILLTTMMIPGQVTLIPMFIIFKNLGWINTFKPLIIPAVLVYPYGVFLLRQFYMTIPDSLIESAKIDGAAPPYIWAKLMVHLTIPAIASLALFKFMGSWNAFMGPMVYLNSSERFTIPLVISSFKSDYGTEWNLMMAVSCVSVIPVLVLYAFTQRYFVEGIMIGAVKG